MSFDLKPKQNPRQQKQNEQRQKLKHIFNVVQASKMQMSIMLLKNVRAKHKTN